MEVTMQKIPSIFFSLSFLFFLLRFFSLFKHQGNSQDGMIS